MKHETASLAEELEASIPQINSPAREEEVSWLLKGLPGVDAVGVARGGIWLSFHSEIISRQEICRTLRQAGFPPALSL